MATHSTPTSTEHDIQAVASMVGCAPDDVLWYVTFVILTDGSNGMAANGCCGRHAAARGIHAALEHVVTDLPCDA